MTFLKEVEAIETSDGMLFSKLEYARAIKHEKMVQAGIDYQNIIAGDYLRDWINENQNENVIDMISDPAIVAFAIALLVAASDHRQAMNEELPFEPVESDGYASDGVLSGNVGLSETAEAPTDKPSRKNRVKAKKQPRPEESNEADPLYLEAVELVRSGDIRPSGKALRDRFSIRHDRAKVLIDCMEQDGVVSEPVKGVRTVLV